MTEQRSVRRWAARRRQQHHTIDTSVTAHFNGDVRILEVVTGPDANGVYEARVEMRAPDGTWMEKTSNGGVNTMFPTDWDAQRVQAEVESAWAKRVPHIDGTKGKWEGVSSSGVKMEGYESPRTTAYPVHGAQK